MLHTYPSAFPKTVGSSPALSIHRRSLDDGVDRGDGRVHFTAKQSEVASPEKPTTNLARADPTARRDSRYHIDRTHGVAPILHPRGIEVCRDRQRRFPERQKTLLTLPVSRAEMQQLVDVYCTPDYFITAADMTTRADVRRS